MSWDEDGPVHDCCDRCGRGSCPGSGSRGEDACTMRSCERRCGHCALCDPTAIDLTRDRVTTSDDPRLTLRTSEKRPYPATSEEDA